MLGGGAGCLPDPDLDRISRYRAAERAARAPISVVPATPPTWSIPPTKASGYYVGFNDGTVWLVGGSAPDSVVAQSPNPTGLAIALDGSLYIADPNLHQLRAGGSLHRDDSTVAGTGAACSSPTAACGDGGQATAATLSGPWGVWVDPSGEVFIADGVRGIRDVHPDGTIRHDRADRRVLQRRQRDRRPDREPLRRDEHIVPGQRPGTDHNADYIIQVNLSNGQVTPVVGTGTSGYNSNNDVADPGTQVEINHPGAVSVALNGDDGVRRHRQQPDQGLRTRERQRKNELGGLISSGVPQGGYNGDKFADADGVRQSGRRHGDAGRSAHRGRHRKLAPAADRPESHHHATRRHRREPAATHR